MEMFPFWACEQSSRVQVKNTFLEESEEPLAQRVIHSLPPVLPSQQAQREATSQEEGLAQQFELEPEECATEDEDDASTDLLSQQASGLHAGWTSAGVDEAYPDFDITHECTSADHHRWTQYFDSLARENRTLAEQVRNWVQPFQEELERRMHPTQRAGAGKARYPEGQLHSPMYVDTLCSDREGAASSRTFPLDRFSQPKRQDDSTPRSFDARDVDRVASAPAVVKPLQAIKVGEVQGLSKEYGFNTICEETLRADVERQQEPCDYGPHHSEDAETEDIQRMIIAQAQRKAEEAAPQSREPSSTEPTQRLKSTDESNVPADDAVPHSKEFSWTVPAQKFKLTDKSIVSTSFDVLMGDMQVPFLVQITASKSNDRKGGHSFKKAKGCGKLEVNCKKRPPDNVKPVDIAFVVGDEKRGPVKHNFVENSLCGLPRDLEEWDFPAAEDKASQTVTIRVEIANYEEM